MHSRIRCKPSDENTPLVTLEPILEYFFGYRTGRNAARYFDIVNEPSFGALGRISAQSEAEHHKLN
jgi:hypothetical protein